MHPYHFFGLPLIPFVVGAELNQLAQPHDARSVQTSGGWSLSVALNVACPAEATRFCGLNYCCPSSLTCSKDSSDIASACCSGTTNCTTTLLTAPLCADNSWSLWNTTKISSGEMGFFCCLPGQDGLADGSCVPKASVVGMPVSSLALELSPGSSFSAQSATVSQHAPTLTATIVMITGAGNATSSSMSTTGTSTSAGKSGALPGVEVGRFSLMRMAVMLVIVVGMLF